LDLDGSALAANWRWLNDRAGVPCGAAIKADGYGLGARAVLDRLAAAGARDFFVSTWDEAARLGPLPGGTGLSVLHGVRGADMAAALAGPARPVLNSSEQVARWRAAGGGACDVMVDTGMNRLGLTSAEAVSGLLDGLAIDTLMSHLACADEPDHPLNAQQLHAFRAVAAAVPARRRSLANSAGILLGREYGFDLARPGLALYGGRQGRGMDPIRPVVRPAAEVIQRRIVPAGGTVGYGATWTAPADTTVAILNLGYADGFLRSLGPGATAFAGDRPCPVLGRVSMDLLAVDASGTGVGEGDWLHLEHDLPAMAARSGLSQYELLTGLGARYQRRWT
jgi:alanine racemase